MKSKTHSIAKSSSIGTDLCKSSTAKDCSGDMSALACSVRAVQRSRPTRVCLSARGPCAASRPLARPFSSSPACQVAPSPYEERAGINPADRYKEISDGLHQYGSYILSCLPAHIEQYSVYKDELSLYVPPKNLLPVMEFLRDHSQCQFKQIADITAVDFPSKDKRFEVVYNLLSHTHQSRVRVKTYANEVSPVPSVVELFRGADWFEREVYDMFGVFFVNHPDLRRILTDYGFEGHPLRKDFPLTGTTEVRYDEEKKRVVSEPLQLAQAFRNYDNAASPWEAVGAGQDVKPESHKIKPPEPEGEGEGQNKK